MKQLMRVRSLRERKYSVEEQEGIGKPRLKETSLHQLWQLNTVNRSVYCIFKTHHFIATDKKQVLKLLLVAKIEASMT
jgi:hypothetical protein